MKQFIYLLLICSGLMPLQAQNSNPKIQYLNTIGIDKNDSPDVIIEKASHVVPTVNQLDALKNEFIAFIHFGPNTFTRKEWGSGMEDPKIFDLKQLDTDQWCQAMKNAGMKMVILTVKHHDGFVLWQSRYTKHGIMSTGFRDGKGDILKDLSASCRKYGLKLGVYLSPADLYQIENPDGLYGNLSKYTKRVIPRKVSGRPFAIKTQFEFMLDDYNEYFMNQLFEILTEYGPIHEVWFDGAHPKTKGGQKYNYPAWKKLIHTLAPKAVIFGREDIRWCGNESGKTRSTEWNVIPYSENPDTAIHFPDMENDDLGSRAQLYKAKYLHYQQAETNTSIREGWFYRDDTHQRVRSADDVYDIYERSVGGNSTFLLNIPPNREGKFSAEDVKVLGEVGERIRKTYGSDLLSGAKGPIAVLDNNEKTYLSVNKGESIVIEMPHVIKINRLIIQEAIANRGERVEKHALDAWINGKWEEVASATNVGYKRILRFQEVETKKIRIRILESRSVTAISKISAHYYQSLPPRVSFKRDKEGMVSIEALKQQFNWKAHGEDIAHNLNSGFKIFYTTDGSEPSLGSLEYKGSFKMNKGELKALAVLDGKKGEVNRELLGFIKKDWNLKAVSSQEEKHLGKMAFDEDPNTYWKSEKENSTHYLVVDLGEKLSLKGFAYTPQTETKEGMVEKGSISISEDGKLWTLVDHFEFGNLINDPVKRYHYFPKELTTRYVKIEANQIAAKGEVMTIAELDLF